MKDPDTYTRRAFLARAGVLGAVVTAGGALVTLPVLAKDFAAPSPPPPTTSGTSLTGGDALQGLLDILRPVLDSLAHDTMSGLAAFALPGSDQFSSAQGTPSPTPGGVAARGADFLIESLDHFVPFPTELARELAAAFSTALAGLGPRCLTRSIS